MPSVPFSQAKALGEGFAEARRLDGANASHLAPLMHFRPIPQVPEPLRGKSFGLVEAAFIGDEAEGAALLRPFRELQPVMDTVARIEPPALAEIHMDPPEPAPGRYGGVEPSALFPPETLRRLQAVKRDVDPDDVFFACHPVAPA